MMGPNRAERFYKWPYEIIFWEAQYTLYDMRFAIRFADQNYGHITATSDTTGLAMGDNVDIWFASREGGVMVAVGVQNQLLSESWKAQQLIDQIYARLDARLRAHPGAKHGQEPPPQQPPPNHYYQQPGRYY